MYGLLATNGECRVQILFCGAPFIGSYFSIFSSFLLFLMERESPSHQYHLKAESSLNEGSLMIISATNYIEFAKNGMSSYGDVIRS